MRHFVRQLRGLFRVGGFNGDVEHVSVGGVGGGHHGGKIVGGDGVVVQFVDHRLEHGLGFDQIRVALELGGDVDAGCALAAHAAVERVGSGVVVAGEQLGRCRVFLLRGQRVCGYADDHENEHQNRCEHVLTDDADQIHQGHAFVCIRF